jgi:hypothetical protein
MLGRHFRRSVKAQIEVADGLWTAVAGFLCGAVGWSMKRTLRVAFSAVCGITCLLVIALWVRSYWRCDYASSINGRFELKTIRSSSGFLCLAREDVPFPGARVVPWRVRSLPATDWPRDWKWSWSTNKTAVYLPYGALAPIAGLLSAVPWMPYRFSLRTLLVATTIVAMGLGILAAAW